MSDLISRKKVIDILEKEKNLKCGYDADIAIFSIEKGIKEMPTAYDIDKVVEQIKSAKDEDNMVCYINNKPVIEKEQAIEIVKHGGVADDVCEWKQEDDNLITSCGDYFNIYDNCTEKFKYCPVCGKKIKVVK